VAKARLSPAAKNIWAACSACGVASAEPSGAAAILMSASLQSLWVAGELHAGGIRQPLTLARDGRLHRRPKNIPT